MGKISNAINHYLSDNRRFADLFNGICFQGETVVRAEDLTEDAQVYYGTVEEPESIEQGRKTKGRKERSRDICKQFKYGGTLRILAVQYRKDRTGLKDLMERDGRYRCVDADTLETMSVMLDLPSIWKERVKYMGKNEEDKEEYDMCQAIREWAQEERSIGREEGRIEGQQAGFTEGRRTIVRNMLMRGMSDGDIMAIAECDQEFIDELRANI